MDEDTKVQSLTWFTKLAVLVITYILEFGSVFISISSSHHFTCFLIIDFPSHLYQFEPKFFLSYFSYNFQCYFFSEYNGGLKKLFPMEMIT